MQKGRKQKLKCAEFDLLYAKNVFCSFRNKPQKVKKLKRQMNRRYRKMQWEIVEEEYAILQDKT